MPNGKIPRTKPEVSSSALICKSSLLMLDPLKNPFDYFADINLKNATFEALFEEISILRNEGELLEYHDAIGSKKALLAKFIVVMDRRGAHWICPVYTSGVMHQVIPLNMKTDEFDSTFMDYSQAFGFVQVSDEQYLRACRLGFENASSILLGESLVKLHPDFNLVACFSILAK